MQVEHPNVQQVGVSRLVQPPTDSLAADTALVVWVRALRPLPLPEQQRLRQWLTLRAGSAPSNWSSRPGPVVNKINSPFPQPWLLTG